MEQETNTFSWESVEQHPDFQTFDHPTRQKMRSDYFDDQMATHKDFKDLDQSTLQRAQKDWIGMEPEIHPQAQATAEAAQAKTDASIKASGGDAITGLKRGLQNLQAMNYGAAALAGKGLKKIGLESAGQATQDFGIEGYRRNVEEAKQFPKRHSFKDVYTGEAGVGGTIDWMQGTLGELIPTMAEAAVGALVGGAIGSAVPGAGTVGGGLVGGFAGRTVLKKAIDTGVKQAMKKGIGNATEAQVRKEVTRQAMKKLGAKVGMGTAVMPMESGGMYAELLEDKGIDAPGTALFFGALATSMEYFGGNSKLIDTFVDALSTGSKGLAKKTAKELLTNIPQEAMQEGGQEALGILNKVVNTDEEFFTAENIEQIIEGMGAGAVGGGAGAVVSSTMNAQSDGAPDQITERFENIKSQGADKIPASIGALDQEVIQNNKLLQDIESLNAMAEEAGISTEDLTAHITRANELNQELKTRLQEELANPTEVPVAPAEPVETDTLLANQRAKQTAQEAAVNKQFQSLDERIEAVRNTYFQITDPTKREIIGQRLTNLVNEKKALMEGTVPAEQSFAATPAQTPANEKQAMYDDLFGTSNVNLPDTQGAQASAEVLSEQVDNELLTQAGAPHKNKAVLENLIAERAYPENYTIVAVDGGFIGVKKTDSTPESRGETEAIEAIEASTFKSEQPLEQATPVVEPTQAEQDLQVNEQQLDALIAEMNAETDPDAKAALQQEGAALYEQNTLLKDQLAQETREDVTMPETGAEFQTTDQQQAGTQLGLDEISSMFPNQEVMQDADGKISVRFKNGQGVTFRSIQDAGQGFVKLAIETGQMSKNGKILGITVGSDVLLDANFADNKTMWHENKHVLDNLGIITDADNSMLNKEFNRLNKAGKLNFALSTHEDSIQRMKENRANMFAQIMVDRAAYRNKPLGATIQKIMDFFQKMLAFGKQSVAGLATEVESGKIYERQVNGKTLQTTVPQAETTAKQWYSALENAVTGFQQKQATPEQWKGMMKNVPGVKQDELDWVGVNEWLDNQKGKVTQSDLLNFIQENNVQLEEVMKEDGTKNIELTDALKTEDIIRIHQGDNKEALFEDSSGSYMDLDDLQDLRTDDLFSYEALADALSISRDIRQTNTKYADYQLPGGKNYKEILLTLPQKQTSMNQDAQAMFNKDFADLSASEIRQLQNDQNLKSKGYKSGHWDESNILAHIRFNERTDSEGNKVLFLEEVQSDWHQEGRKRGYAEDEVTDKERDDLSSRLWRANSDIERYTTQVDAIRADNQATTEQLSDAILQRDIAIRESETLTELYDADRAIGSKVPDAPFKKSWPLLAMKRMVRYAAENGFDKIAWTTGQQQVDRYGEANINVEGMKTFYDKMLPSMINKEFNRGKWGKAKTEVIESNVMQDVNVSKEEALKAFDSGKNVFIGPEIAISRDEIINHEYVNDITTIGVLQNLALPITDRMKDKALREGMPQFQTTESETTLHDILIDAKQDEGMTGQLAEFMSQFIPDSKLDMPVRIDPNARSASYNRFKGITIRDRDHLKTSLHELVHGVTVQEMVANPDIKAKVTSLMNIVAEEATKAAHITPAQIAEIKIAKTSRGFKERFPKGSDIDPVAQLGYALLNEKEFLSQAFSSKQVQGFMQSIQIKDQDTGMFMTLWDKFISLIMNSLGIPKTQNTAFGEALKLTAELAQADVGNAHQAVNIKAFDFDESLDTTAQAPQKLSDAEYTKRFKKRKNQLQNILQTVKIRGFDAKLLADKLFGATSTRLNNAYKGLGAKVRELDFNTSQSIIKSLHVARPLLEATKKMSPEDRHAFDSARRQADTVKVNKIAAKYGMLEDMEKFRDTLNTIRQEALKVGYDVGFVDEYWPRVIKDQEGFLQATQEISQRADFTEAFKVKAKEMGLTFEEFNREFPEVKADMISNMILGRSYGIGGPGNIQGRVYDIVPEELEKFYMQSDAALMQYIFSMTKKIEARKFFGKVPPTIAAHKAGKNKAKADLLQLNTRNQLDETDEISQLMDEQAIALQDKIILHEEALNIHKNQEDYTENIGAYINDLITTGKLNQKDEHVVRSILNARFNEHGTTGAVNAYKNAAYIDVMGNPISALTQLGDLAWAAYVGKAWTPKGFSRTVKHAINATLNKSKITKENLGLERIAQEFADGTTMGNAVDFVFKKVGLTKIDSIGKETLINNALLGYQDQIKTPEGIARLKKKITPIFGVKTNQVIQDLSASNIDDSNVTDNVKLLLYSRLLDFQPAALSEMPELYLRGGNGRVFYMLKTYTIKQMDVFRNEVFQEIQSGDPQRVKDGITNMVKLLSVLTLANAGADELKDLVLGKEVKFKDNVIENFLTIGGGSRYMQMQVTREGVGSAMLQKILPPMKFVDSVSQDLNERIVTGDVANYGRVLDSMPFAGKWAYWHYGRGAANKKTIEEQDFKKADKEHRKFKKKFEKAEDKRLFLQTNPDEFKQMKLYENFQSNLNGLTATENKLKKIEQTPAVVKRLGQLAGRKNLVYDSYFEAAKNLRAQ